MAKVVARLSGVVSYSDGSSDQFAVHLDDRGNLSYNSKAGSSQAIKEVDSDANWLDLMLAPLTDLSLSPSGTPVKTVTGMSAELSGRVSVDAPTGAAPAWEDFIVQFTTNTGDAGVLGASQPIGGTASAWAKAKVAGSSRLNAMLNDLGMTVS